MKRKILAAVLAVPLVAGCTTVVSGEAVPVVGVQTSTPVTSNGTVSPSAAATTAPPDSPYVYGGVTGPTPVPGLTTGAGPTGTWVAARGGLAPGVSIGQENVSRRAYSRCTVGLIAKRGTERFAVTAGHCAEPAATHFPTVSYVDAAEPRRAVTAGVYIASRDGAVATGAGLPVATDMAVIGLTPGARVATGKVGGKYRVTEILQPDGLRVGMQLCKVGATTAETCGPVASVGASFVTARIAVDKGDSGSLGFVKKKDGTVAAVGILSTNAGTFYYLRPALHSLDLTLVTD